ncbi:hypothetical protein PMZ80_001384 [Knufia obscura]|uniref:RNase III domain-containing protein n=1 Tax=Knufia obscura TaxID=1635080 RepID=A0ABR0S343_9EURO|nr:hypothetical protein PMZ80_001384 [Knufia obscura]
MTTCEDKVARCEALLHHEFQDKLLCLEALQRSGHRLPWNGSLLKVRKNEELAILGDAIMKAHLCEWDVATKALITDKALSEVGAGIGLESCIILNDGTVKVFEKAMASTVEALIGAVFCDAGETAFKKLPETLGLDHEYLQPVSLASLFFP